MCGIAGVVGSPISGDLMRLAARSLQHRGPDDHGVECHDDWGLAHTRLSILDLDERSKCPFARGAVTLVYNGELWNYRQQRAGLEHVRGRTFTTSGDTEVVAQLLADYGERALDMMEGMFAFAWVSTHEDGVVNLARDRFGEVPVHFAPLPDGDVIDGRRLGLPYSAPGFAFASEVKTLIDLGCFPAWIEMLDPGTVARFERGPRCWRMTQRRYYEAPFEPAQTTLPEAGEKMRALMADAVRERSISDVSVCTLLSGGIDSTAVAYHLAQEVPNLVAYTAVFNPRSQDARLARVAADHIGIELREVHVPLPTRADLVDVIERIEMPFKAQVEIGWPCLWLARQMQEDGFKVCFSGEGSDELWASYGFSYHVLQRTFGGRTVFGGDVPFEIEREREWCRYRRDTFTGQHRKNFPRCNKVFMAHGVECRLPFLHTPLAEFALSMPVDVCVVRRPGEGPSKQKAIMYEAWDGLVPEKIVKRHKVAFQEGMGIKDAIAASFGEDNPKVFYGQTYKRIYGGNGGP